MYSGNSHIIPAGHYGTATFTIQGLSGFLLKCSYLGLFLQSMYAWFFWNLHPLIVPSFCIISFIIFKANSDFQLHFTAKTMVMAALLLMASLYPIPELNVKDFSFNIIVIMPVLLIIFCDDAIKNALLQFFTKAIGLLLFLSLCIWIVLLAGFHLPNHGILVHPAWEVYLYENYILCIKNTELYTTRFNGIFLEPGHLGMIASFLLIANRFDIKRKEVLVLLIAIIFTFSLAGYVLILIAFFFYILFYKRKATYFFTALSLLICAFYFFTTYNRGKNVINEEIISRLQYDESKGDIAGNNRVDENFNDYYRHFLSSPKLWTGITSVKFDQARFEPGNAGYKVFIVEFGIIGTVLISLFYLFVALTNNTKMALLFLIVYIFAFLQRAYPLWACELLIFITALPPGIKKENEE